MLIYFCVFLLPVISWMTPQLKESSYWRYFVYMVLCIFFCMGYMTGSDWRQYEEMYKYASINDVNIIEPGYYIYSLLMKSLGFSYWTFTILTKVMCFSVFIHVIRKYVTYEFYIVLFLSLYGFLMLFIDCPMRNMIALTIFLFGLKYIVERSFVKYFAVCLIALQFHITVFPFILLYPFYNSKLSSKLLIAILAVVWLFITPDSIFIQKYLFLYMGGTEHVGDKLMAYFVYSGDSNMGSLFTIGTVVRLILFVLLMINRTKITRLKYGNCFFNMAFLYFLFYKIGLSIIIFQRLTLYMEPFYYIALGNMLYQYKNAKFKCLSAYYIFFVMLFPSYTVITSSYKYIPYTNYLLHFNKNLNYSRRSNYNFINSPYAK